MHGTATGGDEQGACVVFLYQTGRRHARVQGFPQGIMGEARYLAAFFAMA